MAKKIAICPSNYIPWKGYFDLVNQVDEFVLLDDVPFVDGSRPNRTKIMTANGSEWLTIPVEGDGERRRKIKDVKVAGTAWRKQHWLTVSQAYATAPYFNQYRMILEDLYLGSPLENLSEINHDWLMVITEVLGITTKITRSADYVVAGDDATQRLVEICTAAGATDYYTESATENNIDKQPFQAAGVSVHAIDQTGYPEYRQLCKPFDHQVSIIDMLLMVGGDTTKYMKTFRRAA